MFGEARGSSSGPLAETTLGNVFDGRTDLIAAFRKAKGFN